MKKSEREVIQDWLENIFKSWEKTNDLEIRVFKFTPLKHEDAAALIRNGGPGIVKMNNGSNGSSSVCGSSSNGHNGAHVGSGQVEEEPETERLVSGRFLDLDRF